MRNKINLINKNSSNPTTPSKVDIDMLAKNWVELLLPQVQKRPVVCTNDSSYNKTIGQLCTRK
jgi:hypothetical protein